MRRVISHIEGKDLPGALCRVVELWRETHATELADLADAIAAQLPLDGPLGANEWRELALYYDPVRATRLLQWIDSYAPDRADFTPAKALEPSHAGIYASVLHAWDSSHLRLGYLLRWPADPRSLRVIVSWLERTSIAWPRGWYGAIGETGPMRERIAQIAGVVRELADPRQRARLQTLVDRPPGRSHAARLAQVEIGGAALVAIDAIAPRAPDPVVLAAITQIGPIPAPPPRPPRPSFAPGPLWLAIADDPEDDQLRHVLADALLEQDDPRGLVIANQLGGRDYESAALIKRHWSQWLGEELARLVLRKTSTFERGMLHAIRIGPGSVPSWIYDAVAGHRELLVVREVRVLYANPPDYARFIAGLPNVTTIAVDSVPMAEALCACAGALAGISTVELPARPAVEAIVAPLLDGGAPLTTLRLGAGLVTPDALAGLLGVLPPTTTVEISRPASAIEAAALAAYPNVRLV